MTAISSFEVVGDYNAGKIKSPELLEVEREACPGAGSCGGMFIANIVSPAFEQWVGIYPTVQLWQKIKKKLIVLPDQPQF